MYWVCGVERKEPVSFVLLPQPLQPPAPQSWKTGSPVMSTPLVDDDDVR
jgi:hypothetical protein